MPVVTTHRARYSVVKMGLLEDLEPIGILVEDPATDQLYVRLRRDWERIAPDEIEVLSRLEGDLIEKGAALGAAGFFGYLENNLSNEIRITDRSEIVVADFPRALDRLYRQHVNSTVEEFVTHLPRYSLQIAAGMFLENQTVEAEGWEEAPADLRLTREMFVAQIAGHSMEPLIPDGSLCVFRMGVTGSRENRLVLVEHRGEAGSDRYTVKRYRSEKSAVCEEGEWRHHAVRLESLNPDYPSFNLVPEEESYRVLAEFVAVLD